MEIKMQLKLQRKKVAKKTNAEEKGLWENKNSITEAIHTGNS